MEHDELETTSNPHIRIVQFRECYDDEDEVIVEVELEGEDVMDDVLSDRGIESGIFGLDFMQCEPNEENDRFEVGEKYHYREDDRGNKVEPLIYYGFDGGDASIIEDGRIMTSRTTGRKFRINIEEI
jgi:hypothetical protein